MVKILSQSGDSLADVYDVVGSVAGIDQLETRELPIVHEMGATVFSERLGGNFRRSSSGAIAQSTAWDNVLTGLGATAVRVMGVLVITDNVSRVSVVTVSLRDPLDEREIPIFTWDSNEGNIGVRIEDNGAGAANTVALQNALNIGTLPSMLFGRDQRQPISEIAFRGSTLAFGAGDVTTVALIYLAFAQIGGLSSRGLPIPSW